MRRCVLEVITKCRSGTHCQYVLTLLIVSKRENRSDRQAVFKTSREEKFEGGKKEKKKKRACFTYIISSGSFLRS